MGLNIITIRFSSTIQLQHAFCLSIQLKSTGNSLLKYTNSIWTRHCRVEGPCSKANIEPSVGIRLGTLWPCGIKCLSTRRKLDLSCPFLYYYMSGQAMWVWGWICYVGHLIQIYVKVEIFSISQFVCVCMCVFACTHDGLEKRVFQIEYYLKCFHVCAYLADRRCSLFVVLLCL